MKSIRKTLAFLACALILLSSTASAGTVTVAVQNSYNAGLFPVEIFKDGLFLGSATDVLGPTPTGYYKRFWWSGSGVPSGHYYFARSIRLHDRSIRYTQNRLLGFWMPYLNLGTIEYGWSKPENGAPQAVKSNTWGQVKGLYRE